MQSLQSGSFNPFQGQPFTPIPGEEAAAAFDPDFSYLGEESQQASRFESAGGLPFEEVTPVEDPQFQAASSCIDREAALAAAFGNTRRVLDFGCLAADTQPLPQDEGMPEASSFDGRASPEAFYPAAAPAHGEEDMAPQEGGGFAPPQDVESQPEVSELPRPLLAPFMTPNRAAEQKTLTPARSYPLFRSPSGTIHVALTPTGKKLLQEQTVLYRFKESGQEKRLIGTSDQGKGRLSSYVSGFNCPIADRSQLAQDVRERPEQFTFGIIRPLPRDEDPKGAETEAIVAQDSIGQGYNQRKGGGGGRARPAQASPFTREQLVVMIRRTYESPEKHALTRSLTGRFTSSFVPAEQKKIRNVVYEYLFDPTESKKDRVHDVGYTTTTLEARIWAHTSYLNDPESKGSRTIPLYNEVRRSPDIVSFRVFDVQSLISQGIPVWELEGAFMQYFLERGEQVLNAGAGGKGSVAHDYVAPEVPK
jgi:hypothetical protein